jgi:hypothetical protein
MEGVRKTTKDLSLDSWPLGQDLNTGPPKYKTGVLTTWPMFIIRQLTGGWGEIKLPQCTSTTPQRHMEEWRQLEHNLNFRSRTSINNILMFFIDILHK